MTRPVKPRQSADLGASGQATAELAIAVPLFAVALIMVVNVLYFVHGATIFDRAVEQWSRANVASPTAPFPNAALPIAFVLGPSPNARFQASCTMNTKSISPFDLRTYQFTLYYSPYGAEIFSALGLTSPIRWVRKKTVIAPYYQRALAF